MFSRTRSALPLALALLTLTTFALATEIPGGPVTGHWYTTGNPYNINGEIYVPANDSLYIHAGVQVVFQGHYKFRVDSTATLRADGTEQDSISFSAADTSGWWHGIRFINASSSCILEYCFFEYGKANGSSYDDDECGGAVYCLYSSPIIQNCTLEFCTASFRGGALYLSTSSPIIRCNLFSNNAANGDAGGGGIACFYNSNPEISYNQFINNHAYLHGGAITCEVSSSPTIEYNLIDSNTASSNGAGFNIWALSNPIIRNNIITNNSTGGWGGGIWIGAGSSPQIINNLIANNSASSGGGICNGYSTNGCNVTISNCTICANSSGAGIYSISGSFTATNCIIYDNEPEQITGNITATFSDIENGWPGSGNINAEPQFIGGPEGSYYLSQIAAGQGDTSPCVDTGDPSAPMIIGTTRTDTVQDAGIVDMGYHYTLESGTPVAPIYPNPSIPKNIVVYPPSPNPFNPSTVISYQLPAASHVQLSVYGVSGRLVSTLVNGWREAGAHEVTFDGSGLPSGVYLYRLEAGEYSAVGKMVLLK